RELGTGTRCDLVRRWPRAVACGVAAAETPSHAGLQGGGRVLVVDDNAINREVAEALLEAVGMEVESVGSGPEAIDRVRSEPFDLILMDCQMPDMSGFEATAHIRQAGFEGLPILALTANVSEEDREASLAAGMNDHLAKPITLDELAAALRRWLPAGGAPRIAPRGPDG
ncbi:MAG: response regulator, partial [Myxococcota bacterium]